MKITAITIFPEYFSPLELSLIGKAREQKIVEFTAVNLREFTYDNHHTVDDTPYGGGAGMVMKPEPWGEAIDSVIEKSKAEKSDAVIDLIVLTPAGQKFNQRKAEELRNSEHLLFACGRYEGIDERFISQYVDEEISIGDFILSGGEFAALNLIDSLSRFIPGVIGNKKSVEQDSLSQGFLKGPVFTRPENFNSELVPEILLSGDHKKIQEWKETQAFIRTFERRPELLKSVKLTKKQKKLLEDLASKRIL